MRLSIFLYGLDHLFNKIRTQIFYRFLFGEIGSGSVIAKPYLLYNTEQATVGKNVLIRKGLRMEILIRPDGKKASISIGDQVNIEQNVHIICQNNIVIGDKVSITGHCAIVDTTHPYTSVGEKAGAAVEFSNDEVVIGSNVFIGYGTIILPGTVIGAGSYVGAMSVVKGVFPERVLIYGSPAKAVKTLG